MKKLLTIITLLFLNNYGFSQDGGNIEVVNTQNITFKSNGSTLQAVYYPGNLNKPSPTVILLHGYPGGRNSPFGLGEKLMNVGLNALDFHFRGVYDSEGVFTIQNCLEDVSSAVDFLCSNIIMDSLAVDTTNLFIVGYSFGGSIALIGSLNNPRLKNIITIEAGDYGHVARKLQTNENTLKSYKSILSKTMSDSGKVKGLGPVETINEIIQMESQLDLVLNAESLAIKNILIIGGWKDSGTLENHILPLYRTLQKHNAKNVEIEMYNDGHSFKNNREELAEKIIDWIRNNLIDN